MIDALPLQSREDRILLYREVLGKAAAAGPEHVRVAERWLVKLDLFYLLAFVCGRKDIDRDWLYERCQEVQADPDGFIDLWPRFHYKSTIITFGKSLQDILCDPEECFGFFSHSRPAAQDFLTMIQTECERNERLKDLFPDVLYRHPQRQSPQWSSEGLIFRRKGNRREATVEAWGLVEGLPTGKHFHKRIYDDVVDKDNVNNIDQIKRATDMMRLSFGLTTEGGVARGVGTRYHTNDPYKAFIDQGTFKKREHKITRDGTIEGDPVLLTRAEVKQHRRDMGPYIFAAQMLQDPTADRKQGFDPAWLRYVDDERDEDGAGMTRYLLVDPASEKRKDSDYTSMGVIGLGADRNYYLLDLVRDRMNLRERGDALFALHKVWQPLGVGYEKYGAQCDIEHIEDRMTREKYRFDITPLGGTMKKEDRIRRLIPIFEGGHFYIPRQLFKRNYEGNLVDVVTAFVEEEYKPFPVGLHDDALDMLARITDPDMTLSWPKPNTDDRYARPRRSRRGSNLTHMSA